MSVTLKHVCNNLINPLIDFTMDHFLKQRFRPGVENSHSKPHLILSILPESGG